MQMSDARFVMLVHGFIIITIVVAVTILEVVGTASRELAATIYGGALGYAGGRTMNNVHNGRIT